jgi:putative ABC transport system substrate-binding protein
MRRRHFLGVICGAAAVLPLAVRAQHRTKVPIVGFLGAATPEPAAPWVKAFVKRLAELGWIEGRTIAIDYRWAEARTERYAEIAAEFVKLNVDIIVTWGSAPVLAAKQSTTLVPIVFAAQMDPVGAGVVASLARPGGNITGMSIQQTDTAGKRLELLREAVPGLRRLAIISNAGAPGAVLEMTEINASARPRGLEVDMRKIQQAGDIGSAIAEAGNRADALYVATDPLVFNNRFLINRLAQDARLPTIFGAREYVDAGGLISYGPNWTDLFRRAAEQVDKILRGTKPADIPVEQPTRLIVNLKTARAHGIAISPILLARADEVIEWECATFRRCRQPRRTIPLSAQKRPP